MHIVLRIIDFYDKFENNKFHCGASLPFSSISYWKPIELVYCLLILSIIIKKGWIKFTRNNICEVYITKMLTILKGWSRLGRDRMVVGFTTTYAISAYHHWCCEFESRSGRCVQHYVIKFVSFLLIFWFPPPIKLTATI